jgi:anaerobic selenocysteine-containing dehydrogenase
VLFRDGYADRDYLAQYTDCPAELEAHLATRTPEWASNISGVPVATIEAFARVIGEHPRSFFRLGYGFTRHRNGAVSMHAAASIPAVTGAWRHEGGGAFYNNGAVYHWNRTLLDGLDVRDPGIRSLDQSRIGPVLCNDPFDLKGGPPVTALFVQSTNPMAVAPDQNQVWRGFARKDLFVCVHEQFMTETANHADIVLPATMFMEHDDVYQAGGHQHILYGPKFIEPPGECRSNHDVVCGLAHRLGADHPGFHMTAKEVVDRLLRDSGWCDVESLAAKRWIDCQPPFEEAHFIGGFGHADRRFHFKPAWAEIGPAGFVTPEVLAEMPLLPDYWESAEAATPEMPFRLVTAPARHFLNTSFNQTPTSVRREKRPTAMLHPADAAALGVQDGDRVVLGNDRGELEIHVAVTEGHQPGVIIVETLWANRHFKGGRGVNVLTSAAPGGPIGGGAFHDTRVWVKPVAREASAG